MVTISPTTSACLLLLLCCCLSGNLYTGSDAGSTAVLRAINCSTAGNYTPADAYATNLNQLLAALPDSTVDKNGGFFNGTAGSPGAPGTAYVLGLCAADFTRADCRDCLVAAAASNDSNGLLSRCPGSTTVAAAYDQCLVHYSDADFLGSPYTDIVYRLGVSDGSGHDPQLTTPVYNKIVHGLQPALATLNEQAANTTERFATVQTDPFALVQCTWDLPPDKCKACLDLLANTSNIWIPPMERKTYSCRLWVSNASFAVFPLKRVALTPDAAPPSTLMTPDAGSSQPSTLRTPDAGSSPPSNNNNDKGPPSSNGKRNSNKAIIAGVTTSGAVLVVVGGVLFCCCRRGGSGYKRQNAQQGEDDPDLKSPQDRSPVTTTVTNNINVPVNNYAPSAINATAGSNNSVPAAGPSSSPGEPESDGVEASSEGGSPIRMTRESLKKITKNFSQLIGTGTFGKVYKGVQDNGEKIAVKELPITQLNADYEKEFTKELDIVRGLKHRNIVKLLGYCYESTGGFVKREGQEIFAHNIFIALCFEYMENGSLDKQLHDESGGMDWQTRYKIIKGICNGLQYLHDGLDYPIFHLDLKPANILLSKTNVPKIADFGISKLVLDNRTQATSSFKATWRYSPPEYRNGGDSLLFSNKYDIFSLGVVMMEIIAGTKGYNNINDKKFIDQVQENWRKTIQPLEYECVKRCIEIALTCVDADRTKRPEIGVIIGMLNQTENNAEKLATTSTSPT